MKKILLKHILLNSIILKYAFFAVFCFLFFILAQPSLAQPSLAQPSLAQPSLKSYSPATSANPQSTYSTYKSASLGTSLISEPIIASKNQASRAKFSIVSEATVKNIVDSKNANNAKTKDAISINIAADAKDNVSMVDIAKQKKNVNGKNKLNCKKNKLSKNFNCSFSDKESDTKIVAQNYPTSLGKNETAQQPTPLNVDGRNNQPSTLQK